MHCEQKSSFNRTIHNFKYLENHGKQRVQKPTIIIHHIKLNYEICAKKLF